MTKTKSILCPLIFILMLSGYSSFVRASINNNDTIPKHSPETFLFETEHKESQIKHNPNFGFGIYFGSGWIIDHSYTGDQMNKGITGKNWRIYFEQLFSEGWGYKIEYSAERANLNKDCKLSEFFFGAMAIYKKG